jgi:membrane protein
MKENLTNAWSFLMEFFDEWTRDNCFRLSAALSYYTIFSLAPILIIVIYTASYFFGEEAASGQIYTEIRDMIGPDAAAAIQTMVQNAYADDSSTFMTVVGIATLIFSTTVTFITLQDSLNDIWKVRAKPEKGWVKLIVNRVLSFSMVVGIGFILMVSLVINTAMEVLRGYLTMLFSDLSVYLLQVMQLGISLGIITLLFAMIFKFLPDAHIKWRNVWTASLFTAVLFSIGKYLISFYIGQSDMATTFGAAASIIVILLWVNYSSLIFFVGAVFIYVYMKRRGDPIKPSKNAVRVILQEEETEVPLTPEREAEERRRKIQEKRYEMRANRLRSGNV